jgi:Zn-dependent protease
LNENPFHEPAAPDRSPEQVGRPFVAEPVLSSPLAKPAAELPEAPQPRIQKGSLRIFTVAGTDVFIHWSWFLAAWFLINSRQQQQKSLAWSAAEYLLGVGVVLLHEFGHVLACRQVGGRAERVVLWPLGGLALAHSPPRPGALLWTVAAGPLVNVALIPITVGLWMLGRMAGWETTAPNVDNLLMVLAVFNVIILVFNLLPLYPLDGGQILQALLWFVVGRPASLTAVSAIGLVGGLGMIILSVFAQAWWFLFVAVFLVLASIGGFARARLLARMEHAPRRTEFVCPSCGSSPPAGEFWRCIRCLQFFDLCAPATPCPKGDWHATRIACLDCGSEAALELRGGPEELVDWRAE